MMRNRFIGPALFVFTLVPILVVSYYPALDWMSGPLMILYILIPLSIVQLVATLLSVSKKESAKALAALQTAIMLLCYGLMVYYIRVH